jgi:hypothetical protein
MAEKVHDLGADSLKIALSNTTPTTGNSGLSNITEIAYTNLATSRTLSGVTATMTTGLYTLDASDMVLTAGGAVATFQYVVLYNDTPTSVAGKNPADPLIGWWDHGSAVTMANSETYTITFSSVGVLTVE